MKGPARASFVLPLVLVVGITSSAQDKRVDLFKNFEYPFVESNEWPHSLEWQDVKTTEKIKLVNSRWNESDNDADDVFSGLTLESVSFGDVTGDGKPEALVVLRYDTGGTQYSYYVYIYSLRGKDPVLLAYFHAGDRAALGLSRVYASKSRLVVELFDPEKRHGDCCSDGIVRKRFRWVQSEFRQTGKDELGTPRSSTRLSVDTFGRHH